MEPEEKCKAHGTCSCFSEKLKVLERKLEIAKKYLEECCPSLNFQALIHMAEAHLK